MSAPARRIMQIKNDLDRIIAYLLENGICDDSNFSIIKPIGQGWEVTFSGAEHISMALDDIEYSEIYHELAEKRSYNIKLIDGGLIQLMYRFKESTLLQHRLAYYPSADLRSFQNDPDAYMIDDIFLDIVRRRIIPFPVRFDFDNRNNIHVDVSHPQSHLTLGDLNGCRIPVTSPLTPRWFVEFILRNFYQTNEYDFVSGLPNHLTQFEESITLNERNLIHVNIPMLINI